MSSEICSFRSEFMFRRHEKLDETNSYYNLTFMLVGNKRLWADGTYSDPVYVQYAAC
jgi:hypothetical protein